MIHILFNIFNKSYIHLTLIVYKESTNTFFSLQSANILTGPFQIHYFFDQLQPMIQQSQFQNKVMFLQPQDLHFFHPELNQEQQKISQSPLNNPEGSLISPTLSKRLSKKSMMGQSPKPRKLKSAENKNPNQKFGHWAVCQNKKYHWFLEIHNHHFLNKHMRRMDKIFKSMAVFVETREAQQCRSHHQKMEKKYHTICKILLSLRRQHYGSENQQYLIQDLRQNKVEIIDKILTDTFLRCQQENQFNQIQNMQDERPSDKQNQEEINQLNLEERKLDENLDCIPLSPFKLQQFQKNIVDQLFAEHAPHNDFSMI